MSAEKNNPAPTGASKNATEVAKSNNKSKSKAGFNKNKKSEKSKAGAPKNESDATENVQDSPPAQIEIIEQYLNKHYSFRYNVVTSRVEFKKLGDSDFHPIEDRHLNSIHREFQKAKIQASVSALRGILNSDFSIQYNPFIEYFNSLPPWDGATDHISALAATVNTHNNKLWYICFKKWLVAMVACLLDENVENHTVLVLSGPQGIGKTTKVLSLVPKSLSKYRYSGTINPDNKDTLIHLAECMLINMDELESLNRTQRGSLKELITKKDIRVRRPYGYFPENFTRRASFIGSVNDKKFLNDLTGSRRFLCFEVDKIDYATTINLENVYSQALYLFKNGFQFYFNDVETREIIANNEQFTVMTQEEELLLKHFEPVAVKDAKLLLATTDIANMLSKESKLTINNSVIKQLGLALHKHNFIITKRNGRQLYAVKLIVPVKMEHQANSDESDDMAA